MARKEIKVESRSQWVRFTLPNGAWFDVRVIHDDAAPGLTIYGESTFAVVPMSGNVVALLPRDERVP
jgi:hypothetical protein